MPNDIANRNLSPKSIIFVDGCEGAQPDLRRNEWDHALRSLVPPGNPCSFNHLALGIKIGRTDRFVGALKNAHQNVLDNLYTFCQVRSCNAVFLWLPNG